MKLIYYVVYEVDMKSCHETPIHRPNPLYEGLFLQIEY